MTVHDDITARLFDLLEVSNELGGQIAHALTITRKSELRAYLTALDPSVAQFGNLFCDLLDEVTGIRT